MPGQETAGCSHTLGLGLALYITMQGRRGAARVEPVGLKVHRADSAPGLKASSRERSGAFGRHAHTRPGRQRELTLCTAALHYRTSQALP